VVDSSDVLEVGFVSSPHGVRGAVYVQLHDPESRALAAARRIGVGPRDAAGPERWLEVVECAEVPGRAGRLRVRFAELRDRDDAEALKGSTLWVDRAALPELAEDEYYLADAIGRRVVRLRDDGSSVALGTIVGLMSNGAQDLFEVEWRNAEGRAERWLFPALPGFVREVAPERVVVELPLGMLPEELEDES